MTPDVTALDALSAGIWILDSQHRTTYVNPHMAALLGRTPAELHGQVLLSFVAADAQAGVREYLARSLQASGEWADITFERNDGLPLLASVSASPLISDSGGEPGFACVIVDVARRRQRGSAAPDHISVVDGGNGVEHVNQAAADRLRSSPEEANLRKLISGGDETGRVTAGLGVSRDSTARKRVEDELRATEQCLRVVLSNLPLVVWATDRDGVATFCAGQALQMLGVTPEDIVGRRFRNVEVAPFTGLDEHVRRALAGEPFSSHIDVDDLTFEAWSVPLRGEKRTTTGATGVIVDVTERRRLETELLNGQKMEAVGRLAGGIAHDFNNNLTGIIGYVDMILGQIGDDKPISNDLKEVQRAAERAAGLVKRLLAFGRREVVQPRTLDLNTVVDGLKPMLERLIGEDTQVVVTLAGDLDPVVGDAGQLEQAVMNLALNARDAMPSGGTLTIETSNATASQLPASVSGPHVLLAIRDTGTGMDARTKARLFEPFFTTKPVGEGTGLGLSTVYAIVKQLGGSIWVDSEIARGSTFRIFMPAGRVVHEPAAATRSTAPPVVGRETILLVEDEGSVRRFAKIALERHGFRVIEATSGDHALSLAADSSEPIALLLTDVVMPRLSGPELAEELKKSRPDLPVLYMSGYPAGMVMHGAPLDKSVRLVPKPFTTSDLLRNVEDILRKHGNN